MKTYTVTGHRRILGHKPGETFDAELPADQEQRLLDRGAISVSTEGLAALKREELDGLARDAGVENPENLANKDEVIAAIESTNNPPAASGNDTEKE